MQKNRLVCFGRAWLVAASAGCVVSIACADNANTNSAQAMRVDAAAPEGFGDVSLPAELVTGRLAIKGRRAWVWRVSEPTGPETIRVVVDGDVESVIGSNVLAARRASLWLRPIGVGGVGDAVGVYEVFGYFEDVNSPGGPASYGFSADELPIEALVAVSEPVRLRVDSRQNGRPADAPEAEAFHARAEKAFALAMLTIRDPDAAAAAREKSEEVLRAPSWILDRRIPGKPVESRDVESRDGGARGDSPADAPLPEGENDDRERGGGAVKPTPTASQQSGRAIPFTPEEEREDRFPGDRYAGELPPAARKASAASSPSASSGMTERSPVSDPSEPAAPDRIFSSDGVFFFSAGDSISIERGEDSNALTLLGGVVIQHEAPDRVVEMVAQRAVMFLEPGPLSETLGRTDVSDVRGVYLEGGVRITDGGYTLRSPSVYYDVQADRAVLIDAVFRTYDDRLRMPLYMRAEVIRQESKGKFTAEKATYANSGFAQPHLSLGTTRMTIEDRPAEQPGGDSRRIVEARGVTLRGGGLPFFWWPWYKGDPEQFPLRTIGFSDNNRTGTQFRSAWDPFTLLGIERPSGFDATVDIDYYTDRGFGFGTSARVATADAWGGFRGYVLPEDNGVDVLLNGTEIDRTGEARGFVDLRYFWNFRPNWDLIVNGFYSSDEALLPAAFRDVGDETEELTTRAYLRRIEGNSFLTLEGKAATTDFIANQHAAQAPGYMVDKLPEVDFGSIGTNPFDNLLGGSLMHTWNASATRMRVQFQEIAPADIGQTRVSQSFRAFGQALPNRPIADLARRQGIDESFVTRVDTRQELATKFDVGPIVVNPFVVGRLTAYDTEFNDFNTGDSDAVRLWGAAGVTLSTSIFRVDDGVDSRLLDMHRVRHIIEPTATFWHAGTTVDEEDLPVYDDDVESLAEGSAMRFGLNQTWQTKRGAPGRWRSVDVITLDVEYAWFSEDTLERTPIGRFYSARPELSSAGEFIRASGTWQISEVFGIGGETIWDVDTQREDRNSLGLDVRHSDDLRSRFEFRQIESQNDTYGNAMLGGTFGDKYSYRLRATYNFQQEDFQQIAVAVLREFPVGMIGATVGYNNITGETQFGLQIQPTGSRASAFGGRNGMFGG